MKNTSILFFLKKSSTFTPKKKEHENKKINSAFADTAYFRQCFCSKPESKW
jgi:hypothetical protein